ncbi:thiamine diphosphokinase [Cytobacillus gottheilii]|uniref:thiamine diphosphokinase n=1 Tax=Cytobacillus gottheilii TaxID=859144 RepID=UPI0009BB00C5|nr:thiamine diphosphokinase [Cytobacillus gottheilii]
MNINILAGGPLDTLPSFEKYHLEEDVWIGVDKGVFTLLSQNIRPFRAFGDFDSVSDEEWAVIEKNVKSIHRFRPEKDETDMEHALNWALSENPKRIRLFGATGGRMDHFFANVQLLLKPLNKHAALSVEIIDVQNKIYMTKPDTHVIHRDSEYKYISFIPISGDVSGLTLKGFKYPLTDCHIPMSSTLCISNELVNDSGTFSYKQGILMVIRSNDL